MDIPLMQYLKDETRRQHTHAEGHPFQGYLAQGKLPFDSYRRYLVYLYTLHEGFERRLREQCATNTAMSAIVPSECYQLPFLLKDLQALAVAVPNHSPSKHIDCFLQLSLFTEQPVALLGVLYVLLGSKHGAKFIAHSVKSAYDLNGGGSFYFDPYGADFRPMWQTFVSSMNELEINLSQRQAILEAAAATFDLFARMGEEIWEQQEASLPGQS